MEKRKQTSLNTEEAIATVKENTESEPEYKKRWLRDEIIMSRRSKCHRPKE